VTFLAACSIVLAALTAISVPVMPLAVAFEIFRD
jgi:hypothetical protein